MKTLTNALVVLLLVVLVGCVAGQGGSSAWTVKTIDKGGQVIHVESVSAPVAENYDQSKFDAVITDGKLNWTCQVTNTLDKRTKCMGELNFLTEPLGTVNLKFEGSVEAGKTEALTSVVPIVGTVPGGTQIVRKLNAVVISPGPGCETPTTHVPGNWPVVPLTATATFIGPQSMRTIMIPAPEFSVAVTGIEIDDKGGKKFFWVVEAKNLEDKEVSLKVQVVWTFDTGETIEPSQVEFNLGAVGGKDAKRLINGAPVTVKKQFKEVSGKVSLLFKKYVK